MLGRFIKRPLIALLSIWRRRIRVLSVTCREHDSKHSKFHVHAGGKLEFIVWSRNVQNRFTTTKLQTQTTYCKLCIKHKETPWKESMAPQHIATALSEIWNLKFRHTKGDSMDTDTLRRNRIETDVNLRFSSPTIREKDNDWMEELRIQPCVSVSVVVKEVVRPTV